MANQFINLPAPVGGGNGAGAAVDVSTMGASKTIVCGGNARATITVEFNNEVVPTNGSWAPLTSFPNTGQITLRAAARWMRMRVSGYNSYFGGTPVVDVGGTDDGAQFASLAVPAADGVGAAVNVSALGLFKTVQVGGAFRGSLIVEVSEDGNEWGQPFGFQTPGYQNQVIAAEFMRVRRVGVPLVNPGTPVVNVGATFDFSGDDGVAISAGTQSVATGTVLFANSNGLSFGMSASSRVTASMDAFRSMIAAGSTATGPTLSFDNAGGVSFGMNGQTITAAAGAGGVALSAGTQSVASGTVLFASSNGISFGMSGSSQITASVAAIKTISAGTTNAQGPGLSFLNGSGVSWGVNGSTITASVAAGVSNSQFAPWIGGSLSFSDAGQSSVRITPYLVPSVVFSQANILLSFAGNAASVATVSATQHMGFYTKNASSLSLLHSTSFSMSLAHSQGVNDSLNSGARLVTAPWTSTITAGDYWIAQIFMSTRSSDNATLRPAFRHAAQGAAFSGYLGSVQATSVQEQLGLGVFSAASAALPASIAFSDINGSAINPTFFGLGASVP